MVSQSGNYNKVPEYRLAVNGDHQKSWTNWNRNSSNRSYLSWI